MGSRADPRHDNAVSLADLVDRPARVRMRLHADLFRYCAQDMVYTLDGNRFPLLVELGAAAWSVVDSCMDPAQVPALTHGRESEWRQVLQAGDVEGQLEPLVVRIERYERRLEAELGPAGRMAPGSRSEEARLLRAALLALVELSRARENAGIPCDVWVPFLRQSMEGVLDRLEAIDPSEVALAAIGPGAPSNPDTPPRGLSAASLLSGAKAAFKVGDLRTARAALEQGTVWYPDAPELQALARNLRPPKVLRSQAPVLLKEGAASRAWLEENADAHHGDWVAIFDGELLGSGPSLAEVKERAGPFPKGTLVTRIP